MIRLVREDLTASREEHREVLRSAGRAPYPPWRGRTHTVEQIRQQFPKLSRGRAAVTVAGRLLATREHGGIRFLDLRDASGDVQLLCRADTLRGADGVLLDALDPGDCIAARGRVTKTKAGEISIDVRTWTMLAKSLAPLPEKRAGLTNPEERARRRELDLLANPDTRRVFQIRAQITRALRDALTKHGFTEVETPILQRLAGGAAARPFKTHHQALDLDLHLRIAPELFLKRLIVGGYERIFELGRVFRNEGIDRQHNPEFTMCELYCAYATVEDLIPFTERLISRLVTAVHGRPRLTYQGASLEFRPPWPRLSYRDAIRAATRIDVLAERSPAAYVRALTKAGGQPPEDRSLPNLIDALFQTAVRKSISRPTHVLGAPAELVPLAKRDAKEPRLAARLQVIAAGMELVNAYTEENDPAEQAARFREQAQLRGSREIYPLDAEYVESLSLGLPPTAGWGLGVDRLVMLAADQPSIRDVLYFPLLRPRP